MSNKLLNTVSSFDLITPLVAYLQDIANGPAAHFAVPPNWSRRDIRRVLTEQGIDVWGLMLSPNADMLMFAVQKKQARRTYHTLEKEGISVLYAPPEAFDSSPRPTRSSRSRGRSNKKADSTSLIEQVFSFLDRLDDSLS